MAKGSTVGKDRLTADTVGEDRLTADTMGGDRPLFPWEEAGRKLNGFLSINKGPWSRKS